MDIELVKPIYIVTNNTSNRSIRYNISGNRIYRRWIIINMFNTSNNKDY